MKLQLLLDEHSIKTLSELKVLTADFRALVDCINTGQAIPENLRYVDTIVRARKALDLPLDESALIDPPKYDGCAS